MFYSIRRMLLDPTAAAEGGQPAASAAPPGQTPAAAPNAPSGAAQGAQAQAPPPAQDGKVSIPLELYSQLIEHRTAAEAARKEAENQKLLALAEAGNGKKALEQLEASWKTRYETLVAKNRAAAVDTALAQGVSAAGISFRSEAARAQAIALLKGEFSVRDNPDGTETVVDKQGRDAGAAVAERLKSVDFAHFLNPTTQGGAPSGGGHRPPPNGETRQLSEGEKTMADYFASVTKAAERGAFNAPVLTGLAAAKAFQERFPARN